MTSPNEVLQLYTALKLHFSSPSYDYVKYQGKLKNPPDFRKRKDKQFFAWLSQKSDPKGMLIANLSKDPSMWIGNILQDKAKGIYEDWKRRQESLSYTFTNEIDTACEDFPAYFIVKEGQHPHLLKLYLQNEVSIETLTILNEFVPFISIWDDKLKHDPVWSSVRIPLMKYKSFVNFDKDKFKKIFLDRLKQNA